MESNPATEIAIILVAVLLIGGLVALVLAVTMSKRKERRHRKLSKSKREAKTSYTLTGKPSADTDEPQVRRKKHKGRRRSSRRNTIINIVPRAEDAAPPPADERDDL